MKTFVKWFLVLILGVIVWFYPRAIGIVAEPVVEALMSKAFDLPVHIDGLWIDPITGRLGLKFLEALNQPDFKRRDHFSVKNVECQLDMSVLRNKMILIRDVKVKEAVFAIESYIGVRGLENNVFRWYDFMGISESDPAGARRIKPPEDNTGEKKWRLRIDKLTLENGTIIFDDYRETPSQHWLVHQIRGEWKGFDFISDFASPVFSETMEFEALFGKKNPAKLTGGGECQFADGANFDFKVSILGGSIEEYNFLVNGIQGNVKQGTFDLYSHLRCVERELDSEHLLTLWNMKFKTPSLTQKIAKYPMSAVQLLLEERRVVTLEIEVDGDICDPQFRMFSAFSKAIQKALYQKTKSGVVEAVKLTALSPVYVAKGLSQIGSFLIDPFLTNQENKGEVAEGVVLDEREIQ